jgi:small-conductance mechanosensitive channel
MTDIGQAFSDAVNSFWDALVTYLPKIILAIIILVVGYIIAKIVRKIVEKILVRVKLDETIDRVGVGKYIRKVGFERVTKLFGVIVFWFIFLFFIQLALGIVDIPTLTNLLNAVILWLPKLIVAVIIIIFGLWIANWVGDLIVKRASEFEIPFPSISGTISKLVIIYIAVVMALVQIGINVDILYLVFGAAIVAIFVGFVIGFKEVSANIGGYLQATKTINVGDNIEVDEYKGRVKEINRFTTILVDKKGQEISIPNARLTKSVITKTITEH